MKILRLILLIILILALVGGFGYLAMMDGEISFKTSAQTISMKPAAAAGVLLFSSLVLAIIWGLLGWMWSLPNKMKQAQLEAGRRKALEAFGLSLASFESGDVSEARRQSQRALAAMPAMAGAKLLAGRAAFAADDFAAAEKLFGELTETANFEIAARKGLADIARLKGNFAAVISHADAALQLSKKSTWPTEVIFKERINSADWDGALVALDEAEKRGFIGKKTAARRRAVVLTAAAHRYEKNNNLTKALDYSTRAVKLSPSFAPAAVMAARLNAKAGKDWAAAGVIETAWGNDPHPALALAYKDLKTGQDKASIAKWTEGLVRLNPDNRESKILKIEEALANNNAIGAIALLEPLLQTRATSRLMTLRAQACLVQADKSQYDEWMHKAAVAPREPDWSDLDPEGSAFAYEDEDWARMVESYGDNAKLTHPRLERAQSSRAIIADSDAKIDAPLINPPAPSKEAKPNLSDMPIPDNPGIE